VRNRPRVPIASSDAGTPGALGRFGGMKRALLAAVLLSLALPVAAAADPPWTAPQNVSSPSIFGGPLLGAIAGGDGRALAFWNAQDTTEPVQRWRVASRAPGAAAFGPQQSAPADLFDVVAYGSSRTLAGFQRQLGPPEEGRTKLQVRFGRTTGTFGHATTVADDAFLLRPAIAANANGDAALAWFADRGTTTDRVYVSLRRAGGSFGHPIRLGEGRIRSVDVAVGPEGQVLVAWDARGTIRTRFRRSMTTPFDSTETIRSEETFFAQLHTAVGGSGRGYVAWSAKFMSEGGAQHDVFYEVAVRPSGKRFRDATLLERQPRTRQQAPIAIALSGRDATVAWSGFDGTNGRVRVASTDSAGRFGPAQDVSPAGADAVVSDLKIAAGQRVVLWDNGGFSANQVFAALANPTPPPSPFGPAEAVSPAQLARAGAVVPAAPIGAVWSNRLAVSNPPAIQSFVQASARLP
jgi:hypothetical protein